MREIGYALRRLRGSPTFTIAAALTLAIAIGATGSVFAVVDAALLKRFPFRDADRVLQIMEANSGQHLPWLGVAPAKFLDWRAEARSFEALAAMSGTFATVTGLHEPERVIDLIVTPSYFPTLGVTPVLGRGLAVDSEGPAEVVISYAYWQGRFAGDPSVLGRVLTVNDQPYAIVGVAPNGWPGNAQLWTRLSFTKNDEISRSNHYLIVYGRLRPGVSASAGDRELNSISSRLAATYPQSDKGLSVTTKPLLDQWIGDVRSSLVATLLAAACVLLIGAANLANLFLVRCFAREGEMAIRAALGATRGRLVRELLVEAAALSVTAGTIGVGLAVAGVRLLRTLAPSFLPRLDQVVVDDRVVAFCALASIGTVLVFGVLPALHASRGNLADFLRGGSRGTVSANHHRLQDGFVIIQLTMALVLLTGAALLVESLAYQRTGLGFRPESVLTAGISLSPQRYRTASRQAAFAERVVQQLAAQPGVRAASVSTGWPGQAYGMLGFRVAGDPSSDSGTVAAAVAMFVSPDYFRTMGIPLLGGRTILPSDDSGATRTVVVDQVLARRFLSERSPIGMQLLFGRVATTIVGVVAPVKQQASEWQGHGAVYLPIAQALRLPAYLTIAVRTRDDPTAHTPALRLAVSTLDRTVSLSDVSTMMARVNESVGTTRFSSFLASLFASVALLLGGVGIYSVLAYMVTQRRREIAVRLALGARRADVMREVLRHALLLTGIGIALGTGATWILTGVLASLFVGINPHDPVAFAAAACLFALVALVAASVPAFRTTRVNPVVVLTST